MKGDQDIGGLVGLQNGGIIDKCYSTGAVSGNSNVGGLLGYAAGTVNNCYWDIETSGQNSSAGGTGKTTTQMKTQSTFTGWDFTNVWKIEDGQYTLSYPYLQNIVYDDIDADVVVNPIPGFKFICLTDIFFDSKYDNSYSQYNKVFFSDLSKAMRRACAGSTTLHIADESISSYVGNLDFSGIDIILGDYDFELTGNTTDGLINTTHNGKLVMKSIAANTAKTFPITDGTYNYTVTFTTADNTNPDISVRLSNPNPSHNMGAYFWDIDGPTNLNATITYRIDKASISPKTLTSISQIRRYDSIKNRYTPVDGNNASLSDEGSYYLITLTNVNKY